MKVTRVQVGLLLASTAASLLALEVGFRVKARLEDREVLSEALRDVPPIEPGSPVSLRQLIQLSPNDRIVYELRPGVSALFEGQSVTTNSAGFRDTEVSVEKAPDAYRIVGLGDSFLFGWSLPDGRDYLSLLEESLAREHPGRRFETINTAVPGYNTVLELATLREKGLAYGPDLVLLGLVGNDLDLPTFVRHRRSYWSWRRSFLLDALLGRDARSVAEVELAPRREGEHDDRGFERDTERVAPEYHDLVGWGPFESALRELRALADREGFAVVVTYISPKRREEMKRALHLAADLGFLVVDVGPVLEEYMEEHGIRRFAGSVLAISATDSHPSRLTHEIAAREVCAAILAAGLLD